MATSAAARSQFHWYPGIKTQPIRQPAVRLRRVTSTKIRYQPRLGAGHHRARVGNTLEERINERAKEEAAHIGVSRSWLIATILADALKIDLDKKLRAYVQP